MQGLSQDAWDSLQPVLYRAQQASTTLWVQAAHWLQPACARASELAKPWLAHSQPVLDRADAYLARYSPWQVVVVSVLLAWSTVWLWQTCTAATASIREKGAGTAVAACYCSTATSQE